MSIKSLIYMVLLILYGVVYLIRIFDGVYVGLDPERRTTLWLSEKIVIPGLVFTFTICHFIPQKNQISVLDGLITDLPNLIWVCLFLVILNIYILRKYPIKWERNVLIITPAIILFMMFLGYFKIW